MDFDSEKFEKELSKIENKIFDFNLIKNKNNKLKLEADIFPEWFKHFEDSDFDYYYKVHRPKIMFNYYLYVHESFYKKFMNVYFFIKCFSYDGDEFSYENKRKIEDVIRFIKEHKNKKLISYKGDKYYKLKLRAYNNLFIANLTLTYLKRNIFEFEDFISNYQNKILKLLITPIKKKLN